MGKKRTVQRMEITPVHHEGYQYELFSCTEEPGTFFYSWFCSPCMAGQIQEAIHPEVGCGRTCVLTMCCPILYVGAPMDKFQAKFHMEERGVCDKCADLGVVCWCLPCELTREWRQIEAYQHWLDDGGLNMPQNKGVYNETGGAQINTAPVAPNPYANQVQPMGSPVNAPPNPYTNQAPNQAPNPYANQAPNPYANQAQPMGSNPNAPPNPYGAPVNAQPNSYSNAPPNPYNNQPPQQQQPPNQQLQWGQNNGMD